MARLMALAAERLGPEGAVGQRIHAWAEDASWRGDVVPLRWAGGLHGLVLGGLDTDLAAAYPPNTVDDAQLWAAVTQATARHEAAMLAALDSAPQTNEVRRSAALAPGFLSLAARYQRPLVLSEIGASAGLNLCWDRYRYCLGDAVFGPADSTVLLQPEWQGTPPPLTPVETIARAGCDLNPLDVTDPQDVLRLLSYIWPDQTERLSRTRAAVAIAQQVRPKVDRADAADWLSDRLETRHRGAVHAVYHSIAWQYFPQPVKDHCTEVIEAAGAHATPDAPLAWLSMEADGNADGAALQLTTWPGGVSRQIGRTGFHGQWVRWDGFDAAAETA